MNEKDKLEREWYREMRGSGTHNPQLLRETWTHLDNLGKVDEVVDEPFEMALENLLADTNLCFKYAASSQRWFSMPHSNESEQQEEEEQVGEDESEEIQIRFQLDKLQRERAATFEEHVARIAADDFRVRRFREKVLGGQSLTPKQVQAFIHSPATAAFSRIVFEKRGIPYLSHTAELKDAEMYRAGGGRVGCDFTVRVEPPGIERTIPRLLRELPFVDESGYADTVMVGEGSVLGELADLADKLTANYPWQSKADIVHFLLTGAIPSVPPVMMYYERKRNPGGFHYGKITLEVAPWVSAKTVETAYRDAKRQVSRNRKYRRLEEKSLKMIRFVAGYDKPPKGRRLLEEWNATKWVETNPVWYYDPEKPGESSRFWRDYHRARRALVYEKRPRRDGG